MKKISTLVFWAILFGALAALPALAQDVFGLNTLNDIAVASSKDPIETIVGIINVVLGLLGAISALLFLYAGWLWMTSRGEVQKIQKAKLMMASIVIGLGIIFASYAIANFVILRLAEGTGIVDSGDGDGDIDPVVPGVVTCPAPLGGSTIMKICPITPSSGSAGNYLTITGWNFGAYTPSSQVSLLDNLGTPNDLSLVSCVGNPIWFGYQPDVNGNTFYIIKVVIPDIALGRYGVRVSDGSNSITEPNSFEIVSGIPKLNIACLSPREGVVGDSVMAEGINFGTTTGTIKMKAWDAVGNAQVDVNIPPTGTWSDTALSFNIPANALSSPVVIANSDNSASDSEYFTVTCTNDNQCSSNCCTINGECQAINYCPVGSNVDNGEPYITSVSPDNGAVGNLVTIVGRNFGEDTGEVWFNGSALGGTAPVLLNASCSADNWHDNYIIIGVPSDATDGNIYIITSDAKRSNEWSSFDVNTLVLPGLCALDPGVGSYQNHTPVTADGINLATDDQMFYGAVLGYDISVDTGNQTIRSTVPNLQNGQISIRARNNAEQYSNPLPFSVNDSFFGNPVITEISSVKDGVYVTIFGNNFGNTAGSVLFDDAEDAANNDIAAIVPSNPMCRDTYWKNNQIVVEVPNLPVDSDGHRYEVVVRRADNQLSEPYAATYDTNLANTALLCAVVPDNGPNNFVGVDFFGLGFNADASSNNIRVKFNGPASAVASPSGHNDLQVLDVTVPADAISGRVVVQSEDASGNWLSSNPLNFDVQGCSSNSDCPIATNQCCPSDFGNYCANSCGSQTSCSGDYNIRTENNPFGIKYQYDCSIAAQSPSPWPDGVDGHTSLDAFTATDIAFTFTRNVLDADLTTAKIKLYSCSGKNTDCTTEVSIGLNIYGNSDQDHVEIHPVTPLSPDTWYQLSFLGDFHAEYSNEYWNIGYDNRLMDALVGGWNFKTRADNLACTVNNVAVTPQTSPEADFYLGSSKNFHAVAQASNCNICSGNYNYNWALTGANSTAANISVASGPDATLQSVTATANLTPPYVNLQCSITQDGVVHIGAAQARILAPTLIAENYYPTCDATCGNSEVFVDFNTQLAASFVDTNYFTIQDCNTDSNCANPVATNLTTGVTMDLSNFVVRLNHSSNFVAGHYYKVTVGNQIKNIYGYLLTSPLSWIFKVGTANCAVASATLSPGNTTITQGNSLDYTATAYSAPDSCSSNGQRIDCTTGSCSWSWQENDVVGTNVASFASVAGNIATVSADNVGTDRVTATVQQGTSSFVSNASILQVVADTTGNTDNHGAPRVEDIVPTNGQNNICPNAAVSMTFTELMDPASVRENVILYELPSVYDANNDGETNLSDIAVIASNVNLLNKVPVDYAMTNIDSTTDADTLADQTLVILNPKNLLRVDAHHLVLVNGMVTSIYGVALSNTQYNFDGQVPNMPGLDSYAWSFKTNGNMCSISYVTIADNPDWFTCANDSCADDDDTAHVMAGNQHDYIAQAKDVWGINLSASSVRYSWSLNNDGQDLLDLLANNTPIIRATVHNENGNEVLIVKASDANLADAINLGSASSSARVNIFLCERPWPGINNFPWQDSSYNFSTYYCPDFSLTDAIPSLPVIGQPIETNLVQANLLKEYIFPVIESLAWESGKTFGSLAMSKHNQNSNWFSSLTKRLNNPWQTLVARGQTLGETQDIIAVRIFRNDEHLSVRDWYRKNAPNPNIAGTTLTVDGYPALQVGNTIYISAFNLDNVTNAPIYTNIYMLAYNIGARNTTIEIFEQLLANFKLNTNIDPQNNICIGGGENDGDSCSSDFDCAGYSCQSLGLKLRRDLTRLGDLLNINNNLQTYGNLHKACSNNSLISCSQDSQCASGGTCVAYYPMLNAGTFVGGQSNSSWPSWQQTFSSSLNTDLPVDPINLFNGCTGPGFDPQTCWNEENLQFSCPEGSLIYQYKRNATGLSYNLAANFESGIPINTQLAGAGLDIRISTIVNSCDATSANLSNPRCGNGRQDDYCSNDAYNTQASCQGAGAQWIDEECDGGFLDNICQNPTTESPTNPVTGLGGSGWWNEQRTGCYPAGSIEGGNLVECTWYQPDLTTLQNSCGGFCGDGIINQAYEDCEGSNYGGVQYSCATGNVSCQNCQAMCGTAPLLTPAAACGDGVLTATVEQCDPSARPSGLAAWDCTNGANALCGNNCTVSCDATATAYTGVCGNGRIEGPEACDPGLFSRPTPDQSSATSPYTCTNNCVLGSEYCGDGVLQNGANGEPNYNEVCDTTLAIRPTPPNSSRYSQYQCRTLADTSPTPDPRWTKCTPTAGGWCGDGAIQASFGEKCDSAYHPLPVNSSSTNQYSCTYNCYSMSGGWCGDGVIQNGAAGQPNYGEACDPASWINPPTTIANSSNLQYICSSACLANSGGWCGDNIVQDGTNGTTNFGERCESNYVRPSVVDSSEDRQYACGNCLFNDSGWCGDGEIQSAYGELCDVGNITEKNVELVFVFDVSRSLETAATNLCNALNNISIAGVNLKITVMPLGDDASALSATAVDDLSTLAPETCTATSCQHRGVFQNLVTNCAAFATFRNNPTSYNNPGNQLRYVSFYDNNTNNINGGVSTFAVSANDNGTDLNNCNDSSTVSPGGRLENWGYATQKIAESYRWLSGYQRIIVPVSDEYAWCGGDVAGVAAQENENNTGSNDILANIITSAKAALPAVHVSPVILAGTANQNLAGAVATATGGILSTSNSGWSANLTRVINSAFCDGDGNGDMDCTLPGFVVPPADITPPTNPTNLVATASSGKVDLSWGGSTDSGGAVSYIVERATTGSFTTLINTSLLTYADNTVVNGTSYTYRVTAIDSSNNISSYITATATPVALDTTPPSVPASLSATPANNQITLNWGASTDPEGNTPITYAIERSIGNTSNFIGLTTLTATSYTDNNVSNGTIYYYRVRARDNKNNISAYSSTVSATPVAPDTVAPSVPTSLSATPANNRITLNWGASTDPEGNTITYALERSIGNTSNFINLINLGATSHIDSGLNNGTVYYYRVKASDSSNNQSAYSAVVSAVPDNNTVAPNAPTALVAVADATLGVMNLSWSAPLSGPLVVSYIIERSLTADFSNIVNIGNTIGNAFVDYFYDGPPSIAVTYYYRVKAVGTLLLQSIASNTASDAFPDTQAPAPAPSALTARFRGAYVQLNWVGSSDNIGVTNYVVQRSTVPTGPFNTTVRGTDLWYDDSSFTANTTYYYQVAARDAAGNTSPYSGQVTVLTRDTEAPTPAPVLSGTDTDPVITLSWTGAITDNVGVTNYIVKRANSVAGPFTTTVGTPTASPWQDTTAAAGSTYYYQVAAQDAAGNTSAYSNTESATAFSGPGKPTISNINIPTSAVSFTMNSSGGVNPRYFTVERADISNPSNFVVIAANVTAAVTGATLYTNSPVVNGTTYYYRIKCTDAVGTVSEYSDTAVVTTQDNTGPTAPASLNFLATPSATVAEDIILSWNAFTDASGIKGYTIERRINSGAWQRLPVTFTEITTVNTTYTDSTGGPTSGNIYEYQLRAVDNSGYNNTTTWFSVIACNVAYCDQWDSGTGVAPGNWAACSASCSVAPQRCCQACRDSANNYSGCRLNSSRPNSCPVPTATGVICR